MQAQADRPEHAARGLDRPHLWLTWRATLISGFADDNYCARVTTQTLFSHTT